MGRSELIERPTVDGGCQDLAVSTLGAVCRAVVEAKDRLCDLDAALGDGDHGISMAKSFKAVDADLPDLCGRPVSDVLARAGDRMLTTVGGAMAPLFGAAFLAASDVARQMEEEGRSLDSAVFIARMIRAATDGVAHRGGSKVGAKTMLDALTAAAEAAEQVAQHQDGDGDLGVALAAAAAGAEAGARATIDMRATVGRASRLGDRSLGHADPGATSVAIILRAAADHVGDPSMERGSQ